jgi:aryl sulfotransferase
VTVRYHSYIADSARWEGFRFRQGDIVISTPPKCGTTWTQMICALLIFQTPELPKPLELISPWLDQVLAPLDHVVADLEAQEHRRFIKTHTPLDGLPFDPRVTYIAVARDPRDTALSLDDHKGNLDFDAVLELRKAAVGLDDLPKVLPDGRPPRLETQRDRFWYFVDDETPLWRASSLAFTLHHLSTFFAARHEPNLILLHYGDLKADLEVQMRRLADRLSIRVPEERWPALVRAASFEAMKQNPKTTAPNQHRSIWHDGDRFFRRARHGEWRELLDEADLRRYEARVRELVTPDVSDWVHRGPVIPA